MIDSEAQAKLDKLARIEAGNRERGRRYLERVKQEGKKQLSAIISGNAYNELCRRRDASVLDGKPLSFGDIIEGALFFNVNTNTNNDINIKKKINTPIKQKLKPAKIIEDELELFENPPPPKKEQDIISQDMPNRSDKEAYKAWLFSKISALKDSGEAWTTITKKLNTEEIKSITGKAFGRGAVQRFYGLEQKRLGNLKGKNHG